MISLETAKALKDAGLVWEPKLGDQILNPHYGKPEITMCQNLPKIMPSYIIWLPRLDQLLAEIGRRGYRYILDSNPDDETNKFLSPTIELLEKDNTCKFKWWIVFAECADSPDEAAAQALLWILNQK
jgi:hypothetical protein